MKKTILITFILVTGLSLSQGSLGKGGKQLNAGFGFSSWGLPVYLGLDFGVHEDITLGLEFSYRRYRYKYKPYDYNHAVLGFSGNANYHFNRILSLPEKLDLYAGINIGFYHWIYDPDYYGYDYGSKTSGLGLGGQLGIRYFFTDKLAINLEGGGGNAFSGGKLGITFKF